MAKESQQQPYDNLLKRLLEGQPTTIIPLLLEDEALEVIEAVNVEVLIPPRRTDRVYKSVRKGKGRIIHFEFESAPDADMEKRLLIYHALLLERHGLPILSVLVYPFDVPATLVSPLRERDYNGEDILIFHYRLLPLKNLDARSFVARRAVPVYGLLPAMQHTTDRLLLQAIDEMIEYYKTSEDRLRDELLCFKVLLERAKRLPEDETQRVLRRIHMFDPLLEEDPWIKGLRAQDRARAREEGREEGELKTLRSILMDVVRNRFPSLEAVAEARAVQLEEPAVLAVLVRRVVLASDVQEAGRALEAQAAS